MADLVKKREGWALGSIGYAPLSLRDIEGGKEVTISVAAATVIDQLPAGDPDFPAAKTGQVRASISSPGMSNLRTGNWYSLRRDLWSNVTVG